MRLRRFIAWDGEGVKSPDRYVLLANSLGESVETEGGLHTLRCLGFVWRTAKTNPDATHVIFAGSYDFNNWLRDCDFYTAECVWHGMEVNIGGYLVRWNRRNFEIEKDGFEVKVWDVFRFWQSSFVKALEGNIPTFSGLDTIREQKARRSIFTWAELPAIKYYCGLELEALVLLCEKLEKDLYDAGIGHLRSLNGAGSVAEKLLKQHRVSEHIGRLPEPILYASYCAYSGGRIELWRYGHHRGRFWTYDIRSAYPYAMQYLPSFAESAGEWQRTTVLGDDPNEFAIYRVRYSETRNLRGFPFYQRTPNGGILYPPEVESWYWAPEVHTARRLGMSVRILDGYRYVAEDDIRPFDFIPDLFARRARLKREGKDGPQQVLKLGLNSLYGKLAQTIGGTADNPPPFFNIAYAGYITARTRAAVYEAAMQAPNDIAYIATDGIGSIAPLSLPLSERLGDWECKEYERAVCVQAGVYFLWDGEGRHDKYRGFNRNTVEPDTIIEGWRTHKGSLAFETERFLTLGSALTDSAWFKDWRRWVRVPRELSLGGGDGKRAIGGGTPRPHLRLEPLDPNFMPGYITSERYHPKWEGRDPNKYPMIAGVTVDAFDEDIESGEAA